MKENNILLSFLYGIPNFYQQFLYEYAAPAHFYSYIEIEKDFLKSGKGGYEIEQLTSKDIQQVKYIYEKSNTNNNCSAIRTIEYWKYRLNSTSIGDHKWHLIKKENEIKGYFWLTHSNKELTIREVGLIDIEASKSLAEYLFNISEKCDVIKKVGIKAPLNNDFSEYLYQIGGRIASNNNIFPGNWAAMYRIIDLKSTLDKLKGVMEERIQNSGFYNYDGQLKIHSEIGTVRVEFYNGNIDIIEDEKEKFDVYIPYSFLTQLVTGYRETSYYQNKIDFTSEQEYKLFKLLFSLANPFIWDLEYSDELQ